PLGRVRLRAPLGLAGNGLRPRRAVPRRPRLNAHLRALGLPAGLRQDLFALLGAGPAVQPLVAPTFGQFEVESNLRDRQLANRLVSRFGCVTLTQVRGPGVQQVVADGALADVVVAGELAQRLVGARRRQAAQPQHAPEEPAGEEGVAGAVLVPRVGL